MILLTISDGFLDSYCSTNATDSVGSTSAAQLWRYMFRFLLSCDLDICRGGSKRVSAVHVVAHIQNICA